MKKNSVTSSIRLREVDSSIYTSSPKDKTATTAKAEPKHNGNGKKVAAKKTTKTKAKKTGVVVPLAKVPKESKCAFIDSLFEAGNLTISQILEKTLAKFPDAPKKATLSTIRCRPSRMKEKGRVAKWLPEPEEAAAK